MHKYSREVTQKRVSLESLKKLAEYIDQRMLTQLGGSVSNLTIKGHFSDSYYYEGESLLSLSHMSYDTKKLMRVEIIKGLYSEKRCEIIIDNSRINIEVRGDDLDWVTSTFESINNLVNSWPNQDYSSSLFIKYYPIRILAIFPIVFLVSLIAEKLLSALGYENITGSKWFFFTSGAILMALYFPLEFKIPKFRELWPKIEFTFGPINTQEVTLRRKAVAFNGWAIGALTGLIGSALFLVFN